jgi:hypothetical protein
MGGRRAASAVDVELPLTALFLLTTVPIRMPRVSASRITTVGSSRWAFIRALKPANREFISYVPPGLYAKTHYKSKSFEELSLTIAGKHLLFRRWLRRIRYLCRTS